MFRSDLESNRIQVVQGGRFRGLRSLAHLYVCCVHVCGVPPANATFRSVLSRNRIRTIEEGAFDGLSSLTKLYVSSNRTWSSRPAHAYHCRSASTLWMNELEVIAQDSFSGMTSLTFLYERLSPAPRCRALTGACSVGSDLSRNRITRVDGGAFNGLASLRTLYASSSLWPPGPAAFRSRVSQCAHGEPDL